jgi:hypothetical protein
MDLSNLLSAAVRKGKHKKTVDVDESDPDFFITKAEQEDGDAINDNHAFSEAEKSEPSINDIGILANDYKYR